MVLSVNRETLRRNEELKAKRIAEEKAILDEANRILEQARKEGRLPPLSWWDRHLADVVTGIIVAGIIGLMFLLYMY